MKKFILIILILPFVSWAQVDSLYLENDSLNLTAQLKGKAVGLINDFPILSPSMMQPERFPSSQQFNEPRSGNPLYIIDGIPKDAIYVIDGVYTDNQSSFIEINPNEIESISIIKETSEILPHLRKPVIVIKTKKYQAELDAKENTFDLAVLDLGYDNFLKMQPAAGTFTLSYLQNRNQRYVSLWNQRVLTGNPEIYEMPIDYDSQTFYGLEFEHKLYMFFKFMEAKHKISLNA